VQPDLVILYGRLKNSFARNFPHDAQLQQFSRTNRISRWSKNKDNLPIRFRTAQKKKGKKKKFSSIVALLFNTQMIT
jgi:hypothetical protein